MSRRTALRKTVSRKSEGVEVMGQRKRAVKQGVAVKQEVGALGQVEEIIVPELSLKTLR